MARKEIKKGRPADEQLWADIIASSQLTESQAEAFSAWVFRNYPAAGKKENNKEMTREQLVSAYQPLVISIVRRYPQARYDFEDMVQNGNIGLLTAADRYKKEKGASFGVYAAYWIRQSVERSLYGSHAIRIPAGLGEKLAKMSQTEKKLTQKLNRYPTADELADELGWPADTVRKYQAFSFDTVSLDSSSDDAIPLAERYKGQDNLINTLLQDEWLHAALQRGLDRLPKRQAEILQYRFGLNNCQVMSLPQLASRYHISKQRVLQIQNQALKMLLEAEPSLKDFKYE